ncbi:uncharacterized protein BDV17DRAFT_287245 [Aspergillus undulatus]|uniref:uncharacterized protein n=1 Tax=Aspergillus undulatus TaxID=1810928 RepID=UPI003CCD32A9
MALGSPSTPSCHPQQQQRKQNDHYPLLPIDPSTLHGLSILITGGAVVTIADIQDEAGSSIAAALSAKGHSVQFVHCDVSDWESQIKAFQAALAHRVDYVTATEINLDGPSSIPALEPIEVNLKRTFYTATLALHYFRLRTPTTFSKTLTLVSSLAGYIDDTHSTAYTASKFGTRGLFRALCVQAASTLKVRVNALCPWAIKTPVIGGALQRTAKFGILPGKGITMVPHEVLTGAFGRVLVDGGVSGVLPPTLPLYLPDALSIAIVSEGAVDIGDDIDGSYGGPVLVGLMALRRAAGDILHS